MSDEEVKEEAAPVEEHKVMPPQDTTAKQLLYFPLPQDVQREKDRKRALSRKNLCYEYEGQVFFADIYEPQTTAEVLDIEDMPHNTPVAILTDDEYNAVSQAIMHRRAVIKDGKVVALDPEPAAS